MQPIASGSAGKRCWIIKRQSATEYPNYYSTSDFKEYHPLTDLAPQKDYNWLTTELIGWKQLDGTLSHGILYKPENFDPQKKYPVIFNYYEKLSHRLYEFPGVGLSFDNINIAWFVSKGYLVFTPDIYFSIANKKGGKTIGEAAYNSVISAAKYLARLPYVDSKRMGIQGHSFGGGETNYLVTHSTMFAAASEMAGGSDPISGYLTLAGTGPTENTNKQNITETGYGRYGANPWERPDLYRRNSAVLNADKVTTPLLIVHNKQDGSVQWRQGVEFYMSLRRLGKKCWMLQYDEDEHSFSNMKDAMDYTIRLTQFFDYYLKGTRPPRWMTEGVPAKLKGVESGYELDGNDKIP
jgi:dipeptidyl aminopeptidase/acylaminoacyl peptidase